jgi:cyclophilin family peptidyl-prolyl cis-trans isomerase
LPTLTFAQNNPIVVLETNRGNIFIELFPDNAPITVDNFLAYVNKGFYDYLLFHRVIKDFMIQGGGYYYDNTGFHMPPTDPCIVNESYNGLSNLRGTIAMARTDEPNSATSQFFINQVDNLFLDRQYADDGIGYCVFGQVVEGLDVVDIIANSPISIYYQDLPDPLIGMYSAYVLPCSLSYCYDLNADGKVNFEDFALFASQWTDDDCNSANSFCGGADFNYSGAVTANDLAPFLEHWLGQLGTEPELSDFTNDGVINFKDLDISCNPSNIFCDRADLNHDSSVNFTDFALFAQNWLASQ